LRKLVFSLTGAALLAGLAFAGVSPVGADGPQINGNDCAGVVVSSFAAPGFGQAVSSLAQLQLVDNLGLADCGQTNRNNP
jgi:hypothetical protein